MNFWEILNELTHYWLVWFILGCGFGSIFTVICLIIIHSIFQTRKPQEES